MRNANQTVRAIGAALRRGPDRIVGICDANGDPSPIGTHWVILTGLPARIAFVPVAERPSWARLMRVGYGWYRAHMILPAGLRP